MRRTHAVQVALVKKHAKKEKTCKAPITSKVGARLWVRNIAPPLPHRKPRRAEQIPVKSKLIKKANKGRTSFRVSFLFCRCADGLTGGDFFAIILSKGGAFLCVQKYIVGIWRFGGLICLR